MMHWLDIGILAIIVLSIITGLFRGFVKELIALCSWALAMWLGYTYSQDLAPHFARYIQNPAIQTVVAFIVLLFGALIVGGIVNAVLGFILKRTGLNGTDRSLGMVFGFIRGVFIVALLMVGVQMTSLPYQAYAKLSVLYPYFDPLTTKMQGYVPEFIKQVKAVDVNNTFSDATTDLVLANG